MHLHRIVFSPALLYRCLWRTVLHPVSQFPSQYSQCLVQDPHVRSPNQDDPTTQEMTDKQSLVIGQSVFFPQIYTW